MFFEGGKARYTGDYEGFQSYEFTVVLILEGGWFLVKQVIKREGWVGNAYSWILKGDLKPVKG